jgi:hypothetical protein
MVKLSFGFQTRSVRFGEEIIVSSLPVIEPRSLAKLDLSTKYETVSEVASTRATDFK